MERRNKGGLKHWLHDQRDNKIFLPKMPSKRIFQQDGRKPHTSPHKAEAFLFRENAFQAGKKEKKLNQRHHPGIRCGHSTSGKTTQAL